MKLIAVPEGSVDPDTYALNAHPVEPPRASITCMIGADAPEEHDVALPDAAHPDSAPADALSTWSYPDCTNDQYRAAGAATPNEPAVTVVFVPTVQDDADDADEHAAASAGSVITVGATIAATASAAVSAAMNLTRPGILALPVVLDTRCSFGSRSAENTNATTSQLRQLRRVDNDPPKIPGKPWHLNAREPRRSH